MRFGLKVSATKEEYTQWPLKWVQKAPTHFFINQFCPTESLHSSHHYQKRDNVKWDGKRFGQQQRIYSDHEIRKSVGMDFQMFDISVPVLFAENCGIFCVGINAPLKAF